MTPWTLYWITRLDEIYNASIMLLVGAVIISVILTLMLLINMNMNERDKLSKGFTTIAGRILKGSYSLFVASMLIIIFLPTTKEMAAIIVIPAVVNNEKVQKEATEFYDLAKDYLKKKLSDK